MRELSMNEIGMISGGSCEQIASGTFGGSIVAGGIAGMQRGVIGGLQGMLGGAVIGAIGGAAAYGVCYILES